MPEDGLDWAKAAQSALSRSAAAMITIVEKHGSAPREIGTRMVVTAQENWGTIGGGRLEFLALEQARKILDLPPGTWRLQDYPLGPLLGQCCGGRVKLLIERLDHDAAQWLDELQPGAVLVTDLAGPFPQRRVHAAGEAEAAPSAAPGSQPKWLSEHLPPPPRPVLLFGAGHVGEAIANAARGLPFALSHYETRPGYGQRAGVMLVSEEAAIDAARAAGPQDAVLILTHDHGLDYRLTAAALASPAPFVGLIGSATKRARFLSRLKKDGIDPARLTCPIGMAGIAGKSPEVIAIAVLAQLLALGEMA